MLPEDSDSIIQIARALSQWFIDAGIQEITRGLRTHEGFVAMDDQRIIGFATYSPGSDGKIAELNWIGVLPQLHRRGVGRALVNAIDQDLTERGFV